LWTREKEEEEWPRIRIQLSPFGKLVLKDNTLLFRLSPSYLCLTLIFFFVVPIVSMREKRIKKAWSIALGFSFDSKNPTPTYLFCLVLLTHTGKKDFLGALSSQRKVLLSDSIQLSTMLSFIRDRKYAYTRKAVVGVELVDVKTTLTKGQAEQCSGTIYCLLIRHCLESWFDKNSSL